MRRNPLLYSDHSEVEEPEIFEEPKRERSWLFYFIILANLLLVFFVLGIIWFLFLKSPDLHIKELTEQFFGTSAPQTEIKTTVTSVPTVKLDTETTNSLTKQDNDEIQQTRLKQMRHQEELAAERLRIEEIRAKLESDRKKAEEAEEAEKSAVLEAPNTNEQVLKETTPPPEAVTESEPESKEAAIIPNAASEASITQPNTSNTQFDQILEMMEQDKKDKEAAKQTQTNLSTPSISGQNDLSTSPKKEINPKLMEKQLEKLIDDKLENR